MGRIINRDGILGLPVICREDGNRLGIVEDIQYDLGDSKVEGLIVAASGFSSRFLLVDFNKIQAFGHAAIIVGKDSTREINKKTEDSIIGRTIIRGDGQELGRISDIIFNLENGQIEGYEISKGVIDDLISGRNILSGNFRPHIGGDVIVVPSEQKIDLKSNNRGILNILSDSNRYF